MFKQYEDTILTEERLKEIAERKYAELTESISIENLKVASKSFDVFLSHKHNENDNIEHARQLLQSYNRDIYLDWQDKSMPKVTNAETATKIKDTIKNSSKFILLASDEAIRSPWCIWELGYGDAMKYPNNIALLPIKKSGAQYKGNEYLQIYPYICPKHDEFYVIYPDKSQVALKDWFEK